MDNAPISGSKGVEVPLSDWVQAIAEKAAWAVGDRLIERHVLACPVKALAEKAAAAVVEHEKNCPIKEVVQQVDSLKQRFALLVGALLGSGILGGTVGALLSKLM